MVATDVKKSGVLYSGDPGNVVRSLGDEVNLLTGFDGDNLDHLLS